MEKNIKQVKPISRARTANTFKNNADWSPGRPSATPRATSASRQPTVAKPASRNTRAKIVQPTESVKIKVNALISSWFEREVPPADQINIVNDSLLLVDAAHNIWRAAVLTTINYPSIVRQHVSQIRFRVSNVGESYSIHNNHIVFP